MTQQPDDPNRDPANPTPWAAPMPDPAPVPVPPQGVPAGYPPAAGVTPVGGAVPPPPPYAANMYPNNPYPPPRRRTNGLAIASLVSSIVGLATCAFGLLLGVLGVVLGIIALRRTRDRDESGRGLAIAGITIGATAVAATLAAIALLVWAGNLPSDTGSRDIVRTTLANGAAAQERYRAGNDTYASSLTALRTEDYRPTDGVAVTIRWANASGFCMEGVYGSAMLYVTQDTAPSSGTCSFADQPS